MILAMILLQEAAVSAVFVVVPYVVVAMTPVVVPPLMTIFVIRSHRHRCN